MSVNHNIDDHTLNRLHRQFGLGMSPTSDKSIEDEKSYLLDTLRHPEQALISSPQLASSIHLVEEFRQFKKQRREAKKMASMMENNMDSMSKKNSKIVPPFKENYKKECYARMNHGLKTPSPFLERLVIFWSNHFTVSAKAGRLRQIVGSYEREAIRPHILGNFRDMLMAVTHHPAMLLYLDNARSIGPNSKKGRKKKRGYNENLAREVLELHTLGVDGGYQQSDVTQFALALTGWTVPRKPLKINSAFQFDPGKHEPGSVMVLGKKYDKPGEQQATEILNDLATHPSTALHICKKLADHFMGGKAPQQLIDSLKDIYLSTNGDLLSVTRALIQNDLTWSSEMDELIPPYDLILNTAKTFNWKPSRNQLTRALNVLGQPMWSAPSPAGWEYGESAWLSPDQFLERVDWVLSISKSINLQKQDIIKLADRVFGESLSEPTASTLRDSTNHNQALAIFIMSPEFQRR